MSQVVKVIILQGIFLFGTFVSAWAAGNFVDNKDGTITDTQASLMWQKSDDGTERTWDDAVAYCESLKLAGHTDWVLPKIHMLENLIEPSFSPTISPVFSVNPSYYWSSSESHISVKSAKYVNFFYGNTYAFSKDNTYYSICVRDIAVPLKDALEVSLQVETKSDTKPFEVRLTSQVNGGTKPYFYEWDFGDGDFSSRSNPVHIFQKSGAYEIDLTVSDNDGTIAIAKKEIHLPLVVEPDEDVSLEPEAIETLEDQEPAVSETVGMIDEVQSEIVSGGEEFSALSEGASLQEDLGGGIVTTSTAAGTQGGVQKTIQEPIVDTSKSETAAPAGTNLSEVALVDASVPQVSESQEDITQEIAVAEEKLGDRILNETGADTNAENVVGTIVSDGAREKPVLSEEVVEAKEVPNASKNKGILTVYASKKTFPAQMASGEQGLLSYSFMNALGGDADWNKDGNITARELKGYLGLAIDNLSGGRQEAEISLNDGDFSLCAEGGVTHILSIGVESYREDTLLPVSFAETSANSIADILTEKCSSWKNLVLTGEKSSRANIFRALVKMRKNVGSNDNFIFYLAGGITGVESNLNLMTYDTLPELRKHTGILLNDLTSLLEEIPAANIIMLFEAGPYVEQ